MFVCVYICMYVSIMCCIYVYICTYSIEKWKYYDEMTFTLLSPSLNRGYLYLVCRTCNLVIILYISLL